MLDGAGDIGADGQPVSCLISWESAQRIWSAHFWSGCSSYYAVSSLIHPGCRDVPAPAQRAVPAVSVTTALVGGMSVHWRREYPALSASVRAFENPAAAATGRREPVDHHVRVLRQRQCGTRSAALPPPLAPALDHRRLDRLGEGVARRGYRGVPELRPGRRSNCATRALSSAIARSCTPINVSRSSRESDSGPDVNQNSATSHPTTAHHPTDQDQERRMLT